MPACLRSVLSRLHIPPVLCALAGLALIWQTPHPPSVDLPQMAGQVATLRDLWLGQSPWQHEVRVNYFAPYSLAVLPAALLAIVFDPATSLQLILSAGWLVLSGGRRPTAADLCGPRLADLADAAGLVRTLLVHGIRHLSGRQPLLLWFVPLADRYAARPTRQEGLTVAGALIIQFFAHPLVFCFSGLTGVLCVLAQRPPLRTLARWLLPYAAALLPVLGYSMAYTAYALPAADDYAIQIQLGLHRLVDFLYAFSGSPDPAAGGLTLTLLAGLALATRIRTETPGRLAPLAAFVLCWLLLPAHLPGASVLYSRYAIFALPLLAITLQDRPRSLLVHTGKIMAISAVLGLVVLQALFQHRFTEESRDFWQVMAPLPGNQRILSLHEHDLLTEDRGGGLAFNHYALWYQADRRGWVDFNFASFNTQLLRYANNPPLRYEVWISDLEAFNWQAYGASRYDYFVTRHRKPLPPDLFSGANCEIVPEQQAGLWSVFRRGVCQSPDTRQP